MHDVTLLRIVLPLKLLVFLFVLTLYTLTIPDFQLLVIFTSKDLDLIDSSYNFQELGQESGTKFSLSTL